MANERRFFWSDFVQFLSIFLIATYLSELTGNRLVLCRPRNADRNRCHHSLTTIVLSKGIFGVVKPENHCIHETTMVNYGLGRRDLFIVW